MKICWIVTIYQKSFMRKLLLNFEQLYNNSLYIFVILMNLFLNILTQRSNTNKNNYK